MKRGHVAFTVTSEPARVSDVGRSRDLRELETQVRDLRDALVAAEVTRADEIEAAHPRHRRSAANLVHYVELRNHDIRHLQLRLGALGLSSLGRCEPYVLATIEAVLALLARLTGSPPPTTSASVALTEGPALLARNADRLLGRARAERSTRIMVTMPGEAADDPQLVASLVANGMDVARINCAHDDVAAWTRMTSYLRSRFEAGGRPCRIAMDLAGPKLRTGPLQPGPRAARIGPKRDGLGRVVEPAQVWLTGTGGPSPAEFVGGPLTVVPIEDADWIERRHHGDRVELVDSRGAQRRWDVVAVAAGGCLASTEQTTYVMSGSKLVCRTVDGEDPVAVGDLPEVEQSHRVRLGDRIILTRSLAPAPPTLGGTTHSIGCSLAEAFRYTLPTQRVWLDDGKIGGIVDHVDADEIALTVTDVRPGGANLKAGKGINLPETDLRLDALTAKDLEDLEFVAGHADLVNVSFVREPRDVEQVQRELDRRHARGVGVVLKIENVAAFDNLPELLLTAMRSPSVGVMIARGDLAVEVGFERLAEVQEEIMWACEAAHIPVIWATQVLDTLARTGQPSRAEITDAAMAEQAECVMLNKGPHISEAIGALDSILTRMQDHQDKKRSLLRRLRAWDHVVVHAG